MSALAAAALIWVALHLGLAGTSLRGGLAARLGDNGFRGIFSILSLASLAFLVHTWRGAPVVLVWSLPLFAVHLLAVVMLVACVSFVGAFTAKTPTAVGGESAIAAEPRGILRVTRHPMLWGFGLWGLAHLVANGDVASLLFFGSIAITAFAGMPSIDAKVARRSPAGWPLFAERTSVLPFGAILGGRNRLVLGEGLPVALIGGLILWAALIWLHPWLFGVPAVRL